MKKDLIFIKWAYDMYKPFVNKLKALADECWKPRDISGIIYLIECIDRNDWNIEHYLFMKYWEQFISEIVLIWADPSK